MGPENGVLISTCEGRRDYTGGRNISRRCGCLTNAGAGGRGARRDGEYRFAGAVGAEPQRRPGVASVESERMAGTGLSRTGP